MMKERWILRGIVAVLSLVTTNSLAQEPPFTEVQCVRKTQILDGRDVSTEAFLFDLEARTFEASYSSHMGKTVRFDWKGELVDVDPRSDRWVILGKGTGGNVDNDRKFDFLVRLEVELTRSSANVYKITSAQMEIAEGRLINVSKYSSTNSDQEQNMISCATF